MTDAKNEGACGASASNAVLCQMPGQWIAPSVDAACAMGATSGPTVEAERIAFEAWMRGHCWALCATWDGNHYRSDSEHGGRLDPYAMRTRELWAAWRDRAALANSGRWA